MSRTGANVASGIHSAPDVIERVLLLAPSRGLGGGIERYVDTLEWAFSSRGIPHQRIDLDCPGSLGHCRMLREARKLVRASWLSTRLIVAHRALLPVASLIARDKSVRGISVLCHGSEIWGSVLSPRRYIEGGLMRGSPVRLVAVSSFTAGAISRIRPAVVLPPGLSGEWFHTLAASSCVGRTERPGVRVVTAFRLSAWREKGLTELIAAVAALGRSDVFLTICGTGERPADLQEAIGRYSWCTLRSGLTDRELASELATADLFVLATRTRAGRRASGEGFGLVLLEAQVAGTPVIGPAYGGSSDAYIDGVTGVTPIDESPAALARVLDEALKDPHDLEQMGRRAAEWARESFAPECYARNVVLKLL